MRAAFSKALVDLAKADPSVVLLTGDHGYALFDEFRRVCPAQYINAGIAEQNMVGMAAGLARTGFRPIVYGLSAFIPIRVLEQIKLDVAHDHLPVIFIGDGAGFVYSHLGTSHQSTEDIACSRSIPNLHVFSPADAAEMTLCMGAAYDAHASVYLRVGKSDLGAVHAELPEASVGKLLQIKQGDAGGLSFIAPAPSFGVHWTLQRPPMKAPLCGLRPSSSPLMNPRSSRSARTAAPSSRLKNIPSMVDWDHSSQKSPVSMRQCESCVSA